MSNICRRETTCSIDGLRMPETTPEKTSNRLSGSVNPSGSGEAPQTSSPLPAARGAAAAHAGVADTARDALVVQVFEQGQGVLAAGAEAVAQRRDGDGAPRVDLLQRRGRHLLVGGTAEVDAIGDGHDLAALHE